MVVAPLMVLITSALVPLLPRLCTATAVLTACSSAVVRQLRRSMAVLDNDLVSISGDLSAGEIIGGSGADSVIITGSLMGSATVTLDSASSTEEANDSLTVGFISQGPVYGNLGNDTMVVSGNALSASLYGGEGNDSFQMALMTSGLAEGGSGADTFVLSGSLKGGSIYGGLLVHPVMGPT